MQSHNDLTLLALRIELCLMLLRARSNRNILS